MGYKILINRIRNLPLDKQIEEVEKEITLQEIWIDFLKSLKKKPTKK